MTPPGATGSLPARAVTNNTGGQAASGTRTHACVSKQSNPHTRAMTISLEGMMSVPLMSVRLGV